MRVSTSTFTGNFLTEIQQLEQQQNNLQSEASSGLSVVSPEDNPAVMSQVLNLQSDQSANSQYQTNIAQLQAVATASGSAMTSLQSLVSQASQIATEASSSTTSSTQMSAYATQVESLIQQALQLANTQDSDGDYLFSGTATSTQPFVATTDASGNVTGVTYQGNNKTVQGQIASNMTVIARVPGANPGTTGEEGLFTDARSGADLFNHLIALQQDLAAGNHSAISSTDAPALAKDEDNVVNQISANGVMQSALTTANSIASSRNTNIASQISGDADADLATTMTELDKTQTAYEAALESGTMVMNVSLLNFLA